MDPNTSSPGEGSMSPSSVSAPVYADDHNAEKYLLGHDHCLDEDSREPYRAQKRASNKLDSIFRGTSNSPFVHVVTLILLWAACLCIIIVSPALYLRSQGPCPDPPPTRCTCVQSAKGDFQMPHEADGAGIWQLSLASELNGLVPPPGQRIITFWNDSRYIPAERIINHDPFRQVMEQMDEAWGALIPPHQGFVPVASPASHDLPLQMTDGHGQEMNVFGISAFHQIHCLFMALRSWTAYHYGVEQFTRPDHVLHCFDFLRQEVMCLGDTALEGADEYTIAQGKPGGTLGWGSKHVCNDWDALHQWAVENEARDAGTEKNFPHDYSHVAEAASTCY